MLLRCRCAAHLARSAPGRRSITIGGVSNAPVAFTLPIVVLLLVLAGLAYVTARRGWARTLRRDGRLGVHTRAASMSDDAFAVANRVAAPVVGGAGAIAVVLAILVAVLPLATVGTVIIGVLGLLAILVLFMVGGVLGEQAARTLPMPARRPKPSGACDGCACGSGGCAGLTRTPVPVDNTTN